MPKYYTPLQAAALLGLSKNTMYKHIREGTIKSVRIGEGRIRIPVSEVTKLVDITEEMTESSEPVVEISAQELVPQELSPQEEAIVEPAEEMMELGDQGQGISAYDWFVGLAALMVVLTFFLFDYTSRDGIGTTTSISWWLRAGFFLWGFGHIMLSLWTGGVSLLKRASYVVGAGLFGLMVAVVAYGATPKIGTSLYVGMSLGLLTVAIWQVGLMKRYLMHLFFASAGLIVLNFVLPGYGLEVWQATQINPWGSGEVTVAILSLIVGLAVLVLVLEAKSRIGFLIVNSILIAVAIYCAYMLTLYGVWDRAMLLVVWAVFGGLFPFAEKMRWGSVRERVMIGEWVVVVAIMVAVVSAVAGMMTEMRKTYVDKEAKQNVGVIRQGIDREVGRAKARLGAVASSRLLLSAVTDGDLPVANEHLRDAVRGSSLFLQLLLLDQEGQVLAYYPETVPTLVGTNLGSREYFEKALKGSEYVSNELFQANISGAPWVAAMSIPVVDGTGQVVGVLAGRLNLELLDEIVTSAHLPENELVYLLDSRGRIILASGKSTSEDQQQPGELAVGLDEYGARAIVASISQVTTASSSQPSTKLLSQDETDCCGWNVVSVQVEGPGSVDVFELTGLVIVLGVMVLVTIAVVAIVWMGRSNKDPTLEAVANV